VTAADCAGEHPGLLLQPGCGVCHTVFPVATFRAKRPPPTFESSVIGTPNNVGCAPAAPGAGGFCATSETATYTLLPWVADPHWMPPLLPPGESRCCHRIAPLLSGSSACTTPDFCPAMSARLPRGRSTRIAEEEKSWSGPAVCGQPTFSAPGRSQATLY